MACGRLGTDLTEENPVSMGVKMLEMLMDGPGRQALLKLYISDVRGMIHPLCARVAAVIIGGTLSIQDWLVSKQYISIPKGIACRK